ncbi:MAG: oligopeptide ABC transporter permease, peptide/nickel transport system permease protein [Armatimonadetes bacterium CSP1-3]|nr:MAG: oligopeptide ABC transporter permease, peptide/nickel transport system permease protein [Armatimonadetes bacterium CSP1-3]
MATGQMAMDLGRRERLGEQAATAETYARLVWRRFRRHRLAVIGGSVAVFLSLVAVLAPWLAPYRPEQISLADRWGVPSRTHPFGTDELGRDVISRAMYAGRISLSVGYLSALGVAVVGTVAGVAAGYYGGLTDSVLMRVVDILLSVPTIPLYLIMAALLPGGGVARIIFIFVLFGWTGVSRLVRSQVLSLRQQDFVEAARALGASELRIMLRHLVPNAMAPIIVATTLAVGGFILGESALSYLGLGIQPPTPSWGNMLQRAQEYVLNASWLALFPGVLIFITVLSFNFLGDGLRDALDPRLNV